MNSPDRGSRYTAHSMPPAMLSAKHARMLPVDTARTACHCRRVSIQAPRNRPAARSRKKIEMRSEERRVGKEGTSQRAPEPHKKRVARYERSGVEPVLE